METPKSNNRKVKRHELTLSLNVFNAERDRLLGALADITTEGLLLLSEDEIPLQREYFLEIRLEAMNAALFYNDGENKQVRFKAFSLWQSQTDEGYYKTGFRVLHITPADLVSISYMIRKFRKKEADAKAANKAAASDANRGSVPAT